MRVPFLLAILMLSAVAQAAQPTGSQMISFANEAARVSLPPELTVVDRDQMLSARFGPAQDHTLELSYNAIPTGGSGSGIEFVRSVAARKGAAVKEGQDRVVLMELGGDQDRDGRVQRIVHWQIGVPNGVFVLTVTAPMPMSPELSDFLGDGLNQIVNSVSSGAL